MVITGIALRRPDKTRHFRTFTAKAQRSRKQTKLHHGDTEARRRARPGHGTSMQLASKRWLCGGCPVGRGWCLGLSHYDTLACGVKLRGDVRTGQNRTFPDIEAMQIAYGRHDDEDRLKTELRTFSERAL